MRAERLWQVVIFLGMCSFTGISFCSQAQSEESGTLVVLGRTDTTVFVSADSKTSGTGLRSTDIETNRKLVLVGDRSACAIDGYLGLEAKSLDVAADLRKWVRKHPHVEASAALQDLLSEAAKSWNARHFDNPNDLPLNRHPGRSVTTLLCGSFRDSTPIFLEGETYVADDLKASHRVLPVDSNGTFLVDGVMSTSDLLLALDPAVSLDSLPHYLAPVVRELRQDPTSKSYLKKLRSTGAGGAVKLDEPSVKALSVSVYSAVEHNLQSVVAEPNNAVVIRRSGRFRTTVEAWHATQPRNLAKSVTVE